MLGFSALQSPLNFVIHALMSVNLRYRPLRKRFALKQWEGARKAVSLKPDKGQMRLMRLMGVILSLHPIHLPNSFITAPIIAEVWKKFCFRETKNAD